MNDDLAPWLAARWPALATASEGQWLAHALLFEAVPGVGARLFAGAACAALLCGDRTDDGWACGRCQGCRLRQNGTHPDLATLAPDEAGGMIKIEQVRALGERLFLTAQYSTGRVAWIDPADRLTAGAVNALLKILEEPPVGSHLLLISERLSAIPATIRSRCQRWRLLPPSPAEGRAWLDKQQIETSELDDDTLRAPYRCLAPLETEVDIDSSQWDADLARLLRGRASAVAVAERACKGDRGRWIDWAYRRVSALLGRRLGDTASELPPALAAHADALDGRAWQRISARLADAARLAYSNSDWQLVVESVLLEIVRLQTKSSVEPWRNQT